MHLRLILQVNGQWIKLNLNFFSFSGSNVSPTSIRSIIRKHEDPHCKLALKSPAHRRFPHVERVKRYQLMISWKPGLQFPPPTVRPDRPIFWGTHVKPQCGKPSFQDIQQHLGDIFRTNTDALSSSPNQPLLHFSIVDYSLYCILMCFVRQLSLCPGVFRVCVFVLLSAKETVEDLSLKFE